MESIRLVMTKERARWTVKDKKLNNREISLINNINLILEMILANSLKFNKLTSSQEIYESLKILSKEVTIDKSLPDMVDAETIISICDAMCGEKGVLIKLKKNDECYYKLNWQENVPVNVRGQSKTIL